MTFKRFWTQLKRSGASLVNLKYYSRWKEHMDPARTTVGDRVPWISFQAIDFLEANLKPEFRVFEYGGGGSTLFFLDRVKEVVTVEHNGEWFNILKGIVTASEQARWTGNFIPAQHAEDSLPKSFTNPHDYFSSDADYPDKSFKAYASAIDKYADGYFDVVLVDGRARPSCIFHAINKVKKDGFLILDNSDRDYYLEETAKYLEAFKLRRGDIGPVPYNELFAKTSIWQKV